MSRFVAFLLALAPAAAHADARPFDRVTTASGLELARQQVPDVGPVAARAQSRLIYLNRRGVAVTPGANDARANRSSIAPEAATIAPWNASDELWSATVACLHEIFGPFDVAFTETDPGDVPHIEAVFGGTPSQLGLPARVAGISPFTASCAIVEYAMVYTFTAIIPQNARMICEVMAQELAHSYGLDHELLAADPMSYLRYDGARAFQDATAACGETAARPCGINGSVCRAAQNSYALLLERLGPAGAGDAEPPLATMPPADDAPDDDAALGCAAGGPGVGLAVVLALAGLVGRRRGFRL